MGASRREQYRLQAVSYISWSAALGMFLGMGLIAFGSLVGNSICLFGGLSLAVFTTVLLTGLWMLGCYSKLCQSTTRPVRPHPVRPPRIRSVRAPRIHHARRLGLSFEDGYSRVTSWQALPYSPSFAPGLVRDLDHYVTHQSINSVISGEGRNPWPGSIQPATSPLVYTGRPPQSVNPTQQLRCHGRDALPPSYDDVIREDANKRSSPLLVSDHGTRHH